MGRHNPNPSFPESLRQAIYDRKHPKAFLEQDEEYREMHTRRLEERLAELEKKRKRKTPLEADMVQEGD